MENLARQTGREILIDVADLDQRSRVCEFLRFAQIEFAVLDDRHTLCSAEIVVGDGGASRDHPAYVHLRELATPPEGAISADLLLNSLLLGITAALACQHERDGAVEHCPAAANFVGVSPSAKLTRELISRAAPSDATVLITGESGTGKEVVARALHLGSRRTDGPFVPVNCGAIPADLLESELFGHEKGAFTGAITQKVGRFELADGGTLFLDEVGDLPFPMQVKLLRALEEKRFERVGGVKSQATDVRILAATNSDLDSRIAAGEFREDLFYRLNVFPIELEPLRERVEDLPVLVDYLVANIHAEQGLQVRFSVDALEHLQRYLWPGNVRELVNLLHRLSIQFPNGLVRSMDLPNKYNSGARSRTVSDSAQTGAQLPDAIQLPLNGIDLKDYLARLEKSLIQQALDDTNAVVARAADRLHIRRTTLVEKMRKHGLGRTLETVQ